MTATGQTGSGKGPSFLSGWGGGTNKGPTSRIRVRGGGAGWPCSTARPRKNSVWSTGWRWHGSCGQTNGTGVEEEGKGGREAPELIHGTLSAVQAGGRTNSPNTRDRHEQGVGQCSWDRKGPDHNPHTPIPRSSSLTLKPEEGVRPCSVARAPAHTLPHCCLCV